MVMFLVAACSDEDSFTLSNGNKVTALIEFEDASMISGQLPPPTTVSGSPILFLEEAEDLISLLGGSAFLPFYWSGAISGIYLQFHGADSYYDIPAQNLIRAMASPDLNMNARRADHRVQYGLTIPTPDQLVSGNLCANYCVYGEGGTVSNIAEICIEIVQAGGENSEFLTNHEWSIVEQVQYSDGNTSSYFTGEEQIYSYHLNLICDGESVDHEVSETFVLNSGQFNFWEDGSMEVLQNMTDTYFNYQESSCGNLVYNEATSNFNTAANWSYDDKTSQIILLIHYEPTNSSLTHTETLIGDIEEAGGRLIFTQYEENKTDYYRMIFEPKN